jgi:hypothetical protein
MTPQYFPFNRACQPVELQSYATQQIVSRIAGTRLGLGKP